MLFHFLVSSIRAMALAQPAKCARYTEQERWQVARDPLSVATHRVGMTRVDSLARLEMRTAFSLSLSSAARPLSLRGLD